MEKYSRHYKFLSLYDLRPSQAQPGFVSPTATVIGEAFLGEKSVVSGNVVIRGDLNSVGILDGAIIGENSVIQTVSSINTGLPSNVLIGNFKS